MSMERTPSKIKNTLSEVKIEVANFFFKIFINTRVRIIQSYLVIDLDGGNVPLSATANHSAVFP